MWKSNKQVINIQVSNMVSVL